MRKLKKKIKTVVEKTSTGFSAYAEDLSIFTTAPTVEKLHYNLIEALNLHYEDQGYYLDSENLRLNLDLRQFFKYYKVINANFLARRIGMNPTLLSQYVQGKKTPSQKQTNKIIKGLQSIGKELTEIQLIN